MYCIGISRNLHCFTTGGRELIVVSGAPSSGKTLVGLEITFSSEIRGDAVFVTGNAPLVEVINDSLQKSYLRNRRKNRPRTHIGYTKEGVGYVERNADFKVIQAHSFLDHLRVEDNSSAPTSADGRVLVFDEAQRIYAQETTVNSRRLDEDEAVLIMEEMAKREDPVIVLLIGHNQHINTGELGPSVWLEAAEAMGWRFALPDETFGLTEFGNSSKWTDHPAGIALPWAHLSQSIRDQKTRNGEIER
ncbi:MAG: hypothetical protein CME19_00395 [Gemmatimonadetes bacterium]|nr:hypothetical protein [Gemmatimonadota bacterium]